LPEKLVHIITKLLKLYPEDRFQTASHVLIDLEHISIVKPNHVHERIITRNNSTPLPRKLIVIGSLYSGAGSTFVALALARVLNHYAIPHALVENIHNQPTLFTLLYGERNVPPNYIYSADKAYRETLEKTPVWSNDHTELHPLPPGGFTEIWSNEHSYKLLYSITQPLVVMDVSHCWDDPIVIELCRHADEIVMVSGPSLTRLKLPITAKNIHQFTQFQQEGRSVHCVANRTASFTAHKEWHTSLPINPICSISEFDYSAVIQAEWGGKLFADQEAPLQLFIEQLKPLLKKIIPASYFSLNLPIKKHTFLGWFK
jgi:serine/threonine-protein kinase